MDVTCCGDEPGFARWTTYELAIQFEEPDALEGCEEAVVTIYQLGHAENYTGERVSVDPEASQAVIAMTQEETGAFVPGHATVMVNVKYEGGEREASAEAELLVRDNLYGEAM